MFVVTNAGRSHEVQPFTYTPEPSIPVNVIKKEISSPTQSCTFEDSMKAVTPPGCNIDQVNLISPARGSPHKSSNIIKNEDVAPMELTGDQRSSPLYKSSKIVVSAQQNLETSPGSGSFSSPVTHLPPENEQQAPIQVQVFSPDPLSTLQPQDIAQPSTFQASPPSQSETAIMQQTAAFQAMESQSRDALQSDRTMVSLTQMAEASQQAQQPALQEQAQTLQQQMSGSLFSPSSTQMQNTIHQLQSGNFQSGVSSGSTEVLVQQVLEAQQQLSCVLFSSQGGGENEQSALEQVEEQIKSGIFQLIGSMQNAPSQNMFSPSDSVHSRPENVLSGRPESLLQQAENSMTSQQQAMETSASMVMEMQQSMHQSPGPMQSDIFQTQSPGAGGIQSPVYQQGSHLMSGLTASEEMQMQCDMFSTPGVTGMMGALGSNKYLAQAPISSSLPRRQTMTILRAGQNRCKAAFSSPWSRCSTAETDKPKLTFSHPVRTCLGSRQLVVSSKGPDCSSKLGT
ncbi:unnamed protein product [Ranitomeya imitator]|uniref:Nuclear factor of activated T-cells 5 n=1 Tax=Ranitomeya imitator TaxID=111125 RepID=A0ABN9L2V4_9NEOB|nr:unnamed protein product [Ranitomeya imitator]